MKPASSAISTKRRPLKSRDLGDDYPTDPYWMNDRELLAGWPTQEYRLSSGHAARQPRLPVGSGRSLLASSSRLVEPTAALAVCLQAKSIKYQLTIARLSLAKDI